MSIRADDALIKMNWGGFKIRADGRRVGARELSQSDY